MDHESLMCDIINNTCKNYSKLSFTSLVSCLKSLVLQKTPLLNVLQLAISKSYPSFSHEVYFCLLDNLLKLVPGEKSTVSVLAYVNENIFDIFEIGLKTLETIAQHKDPTVEKHLPNIYLSLTSIIFSEVEYIDELFKDDELLTRWVDFNYGLLAMLYNIPKLNILVVVKANNTVPRSYRRSNNRTFSLG
ncbi:hypothetical protein RF11_06150 [Thelohanellus kitauei]|uniref:Uncharacterized protein n=1 Tax=Thelohanellus kitauei TaxID=669202 RepID=A0A0C2MCS3_THEKT|nr:hypothetical protein RF11_06150 [Thelohanellus kitauei]